MNSELWSGESSIKKPFKFQRGRCQKSSFLHNLLILAYCYGRTKNLEKHIGFELFETIPLVVGNSHIIWYLFEIFYLIHVTKNFDSKAQRSLQNVFLRKSTNYSTVAFSPKNSAD